MRIAITFDLECGRRMFLKWLEEFTLAARAIPIRQDGGSGVRLQPMRLRVVGGERSSSRLDCLFEAIFEPDEEENDAYLMGAVMEFQLMMRGDGKCGVTAIGQHRGIASYFAGLVEEIGRVYPEAHKSVKDQMREYRLLSGASDSVLVGNRRGRPPRPEYDAAWDMIMSGSNRSESYERYIAETGQVDSRGTKKRFDEAMRYRARRSHAKDRIA